MREIRNNQFNIPRSCLSSLDLTLYLSIKQNKEKQSIYIK